MTDYDFRNLSPIDFELLIRDLLGAEEDILLETFAVGPDGGIDCRFQDEERLVIVQCKHRPDASRAQIRRAVEAELDSPALTPLPDGLMSTMDLAYHFVISADLSPAGVDEITDSIKDAFPGKVRVWTKGSLNALLARHQNIERRHFKLWLNNAEMLKQIMGLGEWRRNESLLYSIQSRVSLYVNTPKFEDGLKALSSENMVIISGAPGVGKSTLAEMLLLTHWEAGWKVVDLVSDISDAWSHIKDDVEEQTIFYYDDFLGQTSSLELQKNEGGDLGRLIKAIRRSANKKYKLVMTTREQILSYALSGPDDRIRNAIEWIDKVRIDLTELSRSIKAKMLFNHLYFGYESKNLRGQLAADSRYLRVIDHRGFNPRILESVLLIQKPRDVDSLYDELTRALDRPDSIWLGSFDQLSALAVRIVLNLTIRPDRAVDMNEVEATFADSDPREFLTAMRVMENTWIKIEKSARRTTIRLYDPSRKDFLLGRLDEPLIAKHALTDANSLNQIEYVLKHLERGGISRVSVDLLKMIEARGVSILEDRIRAEDEYVPGRAGNRVRPLDRASISSELSSCCNIVSRISPETRLKVALERATFQLETDWPWKYIPSSSDLLNLADALIRLPDRWALSRAFTCAHTAIDGLETIEDLEQLVDTQEKFYEARGADLVADDKIQQILDDEVYQVGQQDDRDLMQQMIDDIETFAMSHGFAVDTESAYEAMYGMPRKRYSGRDVTAGSASVQVLSENSDESIASLFSLLKN